MEGLLEFLFGASGRVNCARYWRSALLFTGTGLMVAVILFSAAGIAASKTAVERGIAKRKKARWP